MKYIQLTQGKQAIVSDEDYDRLTCHKWHYHPAGQGKPGYARTRIYQNGTSFCVYMHHFILHRQNGLEIDHVDGNGLNNQRDNLRYATSHKNKCNRGSETGSSSRFKGVAWHYIGKWTARIRVNNRNLYL